MNTQAVFIIFVMKYVIKYDEHIISLSAMPEFLLEFQACFEVYIQKGCSATAWIDNRIGNASINMAEKTGGYECYSAPDK